MKQGSTNRTSQTKTALRLRQAPGIILAILVLSLIGITLLVLTLARQEERRNAREIQDKGTYLVSLISLYPTTGLAPERRSLFLRTLAQYTTHEGLLYLVIHGERGETLISMAPPEVSSRVPDTVLSTSINATALVSQSYRPPGSPYTVYEFAKPVFEDGRRVGAVRLGLRLYPVELFSMKWVSLFSMIVFLLVVALLLAYYGMSAALRDLKATCANALGLTSGAQVRAPGRGNLVMPVLKELEASFAHTGRRINEITEDNVRLVSRLGVAGFEKNQFANVLDSINFGIVVTDLQNRVAFINEYMVKLVGATRESLLNRSLDEVFPQEEIREFVSRSENSSGDAKSMETSFGDHAPGEIFHVSLSLLASGEKTVMGKMVSVRNVTAVTAAKKAQEEFIAHVAHELMTSLTNIRAYSEMLLDGEVENADMQKEFFNTINQETKRLTGTIQNLLNISKMEMGSLTLNKGLLRTDYLVDDCVSTIEASAGSKSITIEKHVPDVPPNFVADKELLKTALINILGNAVKYTPEGGKIVFVMEEHDSAMAFDIRDTGYGIAEEDLPHVFEKFYRSSRPELAGQPGTGLGLAIAYEIVHLHDGDIEVQSKVGEGTHFTVRIPKENYTIGRQ